ncbi:MAG TPA: hypothetical protein VMC44_04105 [Geobacteraceae bacterium]|nr:hypothetical protein [Geobacteraceae bacterium]
MYSNIRLNASLLIYLACFSALTGCARIQYESAAKEWCTAIRANQMVPVYPLNQDVRPGDVYLVQNPIGQQAEEYKDKGFLSLDDHRTRLRLEPVTYGKMYFDGYFKAEERPPSSYPILTPESTEIVIDNGTKVPTALTATAAPRVAFPSYSFSINSGEGLSLAVPVSSIPVALNFLGAQESSAIVTLANASTYQADHETIMNKLLLWVENPQVRNELMAACRYVGKDYVFLRVIKRVYLVGAVDVAIERKGNYQGSMQAGLAEQATDPQISVETFSQIIAKQTALLKQLNSIAAANKIGGAVNFNIATQRNVGLRESFDRPLVVGYLGMDVPFFKDGRLGAPIPTFEHLNLPTQFGDPKPIDLEKLLQATELFKMAASDPETRLQAIIAAAQFCVKNDGPFTSLGKIAEEIRQDLVAGVNVPDSKIKNFTRDLIVEINYQSTVGTGKEERRVRYEEELRSTLRDQGI